MDRNSNLSSKEYIFKNLRPTFWVNEKRNKIAAKVIWQKNLDLEKWKSCQKWTKQNYSDFKDIWFCQQSDPIRIFFVILCYTGPGPNFLTLKVAA